MPCEIFISFKNLDKNNKKTIESYAGEMLSQRLAKEGYSAFYSNVSLEKEGESDYKAIIDNALEEAKILIVVTSSRENCESGWVDYEWNGFQKDILGGVKPDGKLFSLLCDGMKWQELPRGLRGLQFFDYQEDPDFERLLGFVRSTLGERRTAQGAEDNATTPRAEKRQTYAVGDIIQFGRYEQGYGVKPIEWQVLERRENQALLISKYVINGEPFHFDYTAVIWPTCSLRKWLNGKFLNTAFNLAEQKRIPTVEVSADKNPKCDTDPGEATQDKVFLLSILEAEKYFTTDEARMAAPTACAEEHGAVAIGKYRNKAGEACCWWWLRSPGRCVFYKAGTYESAGSYDAAGVYSDGSITYDGNNYDLVDCSHGVRPAMWIELDS